MKKYEEYKNSDIGDLPKLWSTKRIKDIGSVNGRIGWKALKADEYVDKGYFFLSTPNIKGINIDYKNVNYITAERYVESPDLMLQEGDILLTKDGSTLGIVNIVTNLIASGTVNSSIAIIRLKKGFENRYFYYLIQSNCIQDIIQLKKDGMGVPHLFQKDINNFIFPIPSLKEQQSIVFFLDSKTQFIDRKIELLNNKINAYKELRRSLINRAICRGLDDNVKLKDSGIDWIGKIPEHWEIKRFKRFANTLKGKNLEYHDFYFENSLPNLSLEYLRSNSPCFVDYCYSSDKNLIASEQDLIIIWDGAGVGEILKAKKGYVSSTIAKLLFTKECNSRFFYFFKDDLEYTLKRIPTGMGIPHLNPNILNNYKFPIPPIEEQKRIADYLERKTLFFEETISNIQQQIEKLQELRKTLINDVVTGKIKVTE